jgi:hypothetical protein
MQTIITLSRLTPQLLNCLEWRLPDESSNPAAHECWVWFLYYDRWSVGQSVLEERHPSGAYDQIFITVSCGCDDMGRSLWREDGSVVYNCCWPSPGQSWVRAPWDSRPYFTVSDLRLPFCRLLRLAELRRRYSTPPPREISNIHYFCMLLDLHLTWLLVYHFSCLITASMTDF